MDGLENFGPTIGVLRDAAGKTQAQIHRAGGPAVSEQSRMEQGGAVSEAMVGKYATAFAGLGVPVLAASLPPLARLLGEPLPEVDELVQLEPERIVLHAAAVARQSGLQVAVSSLRIRESGGAVAAQLGPWGTMTRSLVRSADQVFVEQEGVPEPISTDFVSPPPARFRSSGHNEDQVVVAVDPLVELAGASLSQVRMVLAILTGGRPTASPWTPLLLHCLLSQFEGKHTAWWSNGPLAALFREVDERGHREIDPLGLVVGGFGEGLASQADVEAAQAELRRLLRPFLDSIIDGVEAIDDDGRLGLRGSALTSLEDLADVDSVAFGPDVAPAAALLASLAVVKPSRRVLTVSSEPPAVTVGRRFYNTDLPSELDLVLVPGMESVAIAQWRGETLAVRLAR